MDSLLSIDETAQLRRSTTDRATLPALETKALIRNRGCWVHVAARALPGQRPLADARDAFWLWRRLRRAFGTVGAACLMLDHLHLLTRTVDLAAIPVKLGRVLSGFTRHVGGQRIWNRVEEPVIVPDQKHLLRTIRYIHLNPCRGGLVNDPLSWPWSTHRGVLGAELDPWLSPEALAEHVGHRERSSGRDFASWFHAYVSSDPSCSVSGTPLPRPAAPRDIPEIPLGVVISAAVAATPWSGHRGVRRHLASLLARHQGWRDNHLVAQAIGVERDWVSRLVHLHDPALLSVGTRILGDERLRFRPEHERALVEIDRVPARRRVNASDQLMPRQTPTPGASRRP